jgi:protein phosphatase 1K
VTWSSIGRPRVNGKLEMTRSIGDMDLKASGVTAEPETGKIRVNIVNRNWNRNI